uniref:Elicitin-like protein RAL2D n=1 Tax=Phytophthora ramorum TaxID=164328 RepID=H3GHK4_PHYRM
MKFLVAAAVAASLLQAVSAASCAVATLSKLLTDQYIDQCAADSGYSFISGVQPDPEEVAGMCASDACHSLLADVEAMNLTECTLPIGDKIYLLADLVDYVSDAQVAAMCASESCVNLFGYVASMVMTDCRIPVGGKILLLADLVDYVSAQCDTDTLEPATATPEPTDTPATPAPTASMPVTCATTVISSLLTDAYIDQCASDSGYSFTSGVQPDDTEASSMCASSACANLLADVEAMGLSECILPIGDKIYLFRDLVDYVSDQCSASTDTPSTTVPATDSPTSGSESPSSTAPSTGSSSTSISGTESPSPVIPGTEQPSMGLPTTESPTTGMPTTDTPEPTSPSHDSC